MFWQLKKIILKLGVKRPEFELQLGGLFRSKTVSKLLNKIFFFICEVRGADASEGCCIFL